jgi:hypothetical protein
MGLTEHMNNKFSQSGQDGVIQYIFDTLNIKKGFFVEFGAWDGITMSNCRHLFEKGWSGIFIEADKKKYDNLRQNYKDDDQIRCLHEFVGKGGERSFDNILSKNGLNEKIDLLSIDVDGVDLDIFESIENNLPTVAFVEGGVAAQIYDPRFSVNCTSNIGQSLSVIDVVARAKGYRVLGLLQDVILIKKEHFSKFKIDEDLFEIYLEAQRSQDLRQIPIYAKRLKQHCRENKLFSYILERTNYREYSNANQWESENKEKIKTILKNPPKEIMCSRINVVNKFFIEIVSFLRKALILILPPNLRNSLRRKKIKSYQEEGLI